MSYTKSSSWIDSDEDITRKAVRFLNNYKKFYSYRFLFELGDKNIRHSVRNHGLIYKTLFPLIILGLLFAVFQLKRTNILLLWWLALFPTSAALTKHLFASRSFAGSPLGPIFAAIGLSGCWYLIARIRFKLIKWPLFIIITVPVVMGLSNEINRYLKIYYGKYMKMSARSYYGFQFGYRDIYKYMDEYKGEYPQRLITVTQTNQPYIFLDFYTQAKPRKGSHIRYEGYSLARPSSYNTYNLDKPTLFAVRPSELKYFANYDVKKEIVAPDGITEFVVIHAKQKFNSFLRNWSTIGLFNNTGNEFLNAEYSNPSQNYTVIRQGLTGNVKWRQHNVSDVNLNLQRIYASADPRHRRNPERCCAEAVTYLKFKQPLSAVINFVGSSDPFTIWINGERIEGIFTLGSDKKIRVQFKQGWNELFIRSCESVGDWYIGLNLSGINGENIQIQRQQAKPPNDYIGSIGKSGDKEKKQEKLYLTDWSTIGLFNDNKYFDAPYVSPSQNYLKTRKGLTGEVKWQQHKARVSNLDLQNIYAQADPRHGNNPEECCADAVTYQFFKEHTPAIIHFSGSNDLFCMWINGKQIDGIIDLRKRNIFKVDFKKGWNEIYLRSCESIGDWYLNTYLTGISGGNINIVRHQSTPPEDLFSSLSSNRDALESQDTGVAINSNDRR